MEIYKDRLIAVLDVLGFGKKVESINDLAAVTQKYADIIKRAKEEVFTPKTASPDSSLAPTNFEFGEFVFDTLVLVSKPLTSHSVTDFIFAIGLLMENFFSEEFPLRGAISYGNLSLNKDPFLFISDKFKRISEFGNCQNWTGCIVLPEAESIIIENLFGKAPTDARSSALHKLTVPMKNEDVAEYWCINWSYALSKSNRIRGLNYLKAEETKYQHTLRYLEKIESFMDDTQHLSDEFHPAKTLRTIKSRAGCRIIFRDINDELADPGCPFSLEFSAEL